MVKEGIERDSLAEHVGGHEVDGERLGALCGLGVGGLDAANQALIA